MKPVEYLGTIFFDLMRLQPRETFVSSSLYLAKSIIKFDKKNKIDENQPYMDNDKQIKRLEYIQAFTNEYVKLPLAKVETICSSMEKHQWGREYDGKNLDNSTIEDKDGSPVTILDLYLHLKEAYGEVVDAVVNIVQDYSSDFRMTGGGMGMDWLGGQNERDIS